MRRNVRRREKVETAANQLGLFHHARIDDFILEIITIRAFHGRPPRSGFIYAL